MIKMGLSKELKQQIGMASYRKDTSTERAQKYNTIYLGTLCENFSWARFKTFGRVRNNAYSINLEATKTWLGVY